jgi:hypothetical protein
MACEHLINITAEEKLAAKIAAQERRDEIVQQAIQNGAHVQYLTTPLSGEEMETLININFDGSVIVDTTIGSDIRKLIDGGWKIISVTYYDNRVCGITCHSTHRKGITIRNLV